MSGTKKDQRLAEDLQIMAALRKGRKDLKTGRTKSHSEVEKMAATWIKRSV
jgi:hypothetical protein